MTSEQRQEAVEKIVKHYGVKAQLNIAIEEASEFIKAISKLKRADYEDAYTTAYNNLIEETADVYTMILQFTGIFGIGDQLLDMVDKKLERQIKRIEGNEI